MFGFAYIYTENWPQATSMAFYGLQALWNYTSLLPEALRSGLGDWDTYRPGQIVEDHENSKNWHAPTKGSRVQCMP